MKKVQDQGMRIASRGTIDRTHQLRFNFDGRTYSGYAGDTLASALLANGVKLVGRSFKYHRPRGILTAGSEEPNALVELREGARREPNTRATMVELFDGLVARSQNRWPSLGFDVGSINSLFSPMLVAGFYYKTFMWPAAFWERLYEPIIRRAAGLGRAAGGPDPDSYEHANAFCDVLVVGGGVAGLSAALAAVREGARVILADEHANFGGQLLAETGDVEGVPAQEWILRAIDSLRACEHVTLLPRTTVFGAYDGQTYGAAERLTDHLHELQSVGARQRLWKVVATRTVLATGAIEQPLVFAGNDRPGVMMSSAVRMYLNRFGVAAGERPVVVTANDTGWQLVREMIDAKVPPVAVVDLRSAVTEQFRSLGDRHAIPVYVGARVKRTHGLMRVRGLTVETSSNKRVRLSCDLVAMAGGWNPCVALATHLGGRPVWSETVGAFLPPERLPAGMQVAGAARAILDTADARIDGTRAGTIAANAAVQSSGRPAHIARISPSINDEIAEQRFGIAGTLARVADREALLSQAFGAGKAFVDFQHDVTSEDVALAHREGFQSVEHLKRYTTLGMATDQGRLSNLNGLALMAACRNMSVGEVGTTLARPPYTPVAVGMLAGPHRGRDFKPTRVTPAHTWAVSTGATFIPSGGAWVRARWFSRPGESDWLTSVNREVLAVRNGVGVCDVSTLGKIDIQGRDTAALLDRVYTNMFSTLPIGKARYGLMLREDGLAFDDGTTARLAEDHFVMTTTTLNAARVMQHLEFARQVLWPELDVQLASVTDQWAQYAIAGPRSKALLKGLLGDSIDLSDDVFPYLGCAEFEWHGLHVRLFRISFSGERAYELAVPARFGEAVMRAILSAGAPYGVTPYGLEAQNVMRIEKGHVTGNELNGTTTARDLGLGRMMSTKKDFIGAVLSQRSGLTDAARPALVGLRPVKAGEQIRPGAHLLALGAAETMESDLGYVTSTAFSATLERWIGLAMLSGGSTRLGERLRAFDPVRGPDVELEVCPPVFLDPEGARLHA